MQLDEQFTDEAVTEVAANGRKRMSRKFTRGLTALVLGACTVTAFAQGQDGRNRLTNPVFRVAKNNGNERPASKEHPLDPAIKRAESASGTTLVIIAANAI